MLSVLDELSVFNARLVLRDLKLAVLCKKVSTFLFTEPMSE